MASWRVTRHPSGFATASIACDCGWTAVVGPLAGLVEANEAARAEWTAHAGGPTDPSATGVH